jgi:lipopolysaccharide heptosyltransferase II
VRSRSDSEILPSSDPQIRNILLIRLRQIGDVVFTTPAVRALREHYPSARLTYIVEPAAEPVVRGNPDIDEVLVAPRRRGMAALSAEVSIARQLRAKEWDLAIDFHGGPRASTLAWLSGARERVGYEVPGRTWMYTRVVPRVRTPLGVHSVLNQWKLLEAIGIPTPTPETFPVRMAVDAAGARSIHERLRTAGVETGDSVIVIHVSAGNPFRRWPLTAFATVAAALASTDHRRRIIVTSGPSERDAAERVIADARSLVEKDAVHRVLDCGDISLTELRALADSAALYIGGDSGPLHVASTSRVPIVALFGPTLPVRSMPWRGAGLATEPIEIAGLPCRPCDQRTCAPGDFRCLTRLEPQWVIDAAERLLHGG